MYSDNNKKIEKMGTLQSKKLHASVAKQLRYCNYKATAKMNKDLMDYEIEVKGISEIELKELLSVVWSMYKRTDINIIN